MLPYALHARIARARGTRAASTTPSRAFARATIASREKKEKIDAARMRFRPPAYRLGSDLRALEGGRLERARRARLGGDDAGGEDGGGGDDGGHYCVYRARISAREMPFEDR
jgi:hypothetical protein